MNLLTLPTRWIVLLSVAAAVVLTVLPVQAFTDSNADLKDAAPDRSARIVVVAKAAPPVQAAWVPPTAKRLDGFKPVLPPERDAAAKQPSGQTRLAKADAR
jgi:hypothetical protein